VRLIETKLILFEGVPGSGKSTLAQTILRRLEHHGIPARWWYEEDANHPVYIFQDQQSLRRRLDQLSGQYRAVIADALEQWRM
jgi:thymidylate kinase